MDDGDRPIILLKEEGDAHAPVKYGYVKNHHCDTFHHSFTIHSFSAQGNVLLVR